MLQVFRSLLKSTLGKFIAIAFLALIAIAFASADISGSGFGGFGGNDRVAKVGGASVTTAELNQAASSAVERQRQENPTANIRQLVAAGGLDKLLDQIIDGKAIVEFGKRIGVVIGDRLIDSEITKIPSFAGPDGRFSEAAYRQILQQQGLSEQAVRDEIAQGLTARQLLVPASFGAVAPREMTMRYAAMFKETRNGAIALIPSAAFLPTEKPTDAALNTYYRANQARYTRPERRVLRYATFGEEALKTVPAPTDAEIAARYNANKAQYAASETRNLAQLIVPTEAAARAVAAEVAGGKTLQAAAAAKGLAVADLGGVPRSRYTQLTSEEVAAAAFAANEGQMVGPARSPLGWHLVRVTKINRTPARSLAQARGEIAAALATEKRRAAFADLTARIEAEFEDGAALGDTARDLGLTVATTPALLANGAVYGQAGQSAPADVRPVLEAAFAMEREGQPQLAEIEPGKRFAIFDVSELTPAAPAPLAEIKPQVTQDYLIDRGFAAAKEAAQKLAAAVKRGANLQATMAALKIPGQAQGISLPRQQLAAQQQVPPPVQLLFSMAEGTTKRLADPQRRGWFVVALSDIEPGKIAPNDPLLASIGDRLGQASGREYAEQLTRAMRREVGVEKNADAVKALATRLSGGN